jgi:conjugative transfer signal peptidase TraF
MIRRAATISGIVLSVALVGSAANLRPPPLLVWNATASAPIGLYRVHPAGHFALGDLVVVTMPPHFASFFAERGYLPIGVPLLKKVAALSGAVVCRLDLRITIDGIAAAMALERDHEGRPLPGWQGCHKLARGEAFLLNGGRPDSLDGRYFGPVPAGLIIGPAEPLWTWTKG